MGKNDKVERLVEEGNKYLLTEQFKKANEAFLNAFNLVSYQENAIYGRTLTGINR